MENIKVKYSKVQIDSTYVSYKLLEQGSFTIEETDNIEGWLNKNIPTLFPHWERWIVLALSDTSFTAKPQNYNEYVVFNVEPVKVTYVS